MSVNTLLLANRRAGKLTAPLTSRTVEYLPLKEHK